MKTVHVYRVMVCAFYTFYTIALYSPFFYISVNTFPEFFVARYVFQHAEYNRRYNDLDP